MGKALAIAGREIREQLRQPAMVAIEIALALLFTLATGLLFGQQAAARDVAVLLIDEDRTQLSESVAAGLRETEGMALTVAGDPTDPDEAIRERHADCVVLIPVGFSDGFVTGRPLEITVTSRPDRADGLAVNEVIRRCLMWALASRQAGDLEATRKGGLQVTTDYSLTGSESVPGEAITRDAGFAAGATQGAVGFTAMFVMWQATISAATILDERRRGTWQRMRTTPTGQATVLTGKLLGVLVFGWLQAAVLILGTGAIFGVSWGHSPLGLMSILTTFIICAIGLGLALAGFVRTVAQLSTLGPIIITGSCMIGGAFWPPETMPRAMQVMAGLLPPTYAISGLRDIVNNGAGLAAALGPSLILAGFAALFLAVGVVRAGAHD